MPDSGPPFACPCCGFPSLQCWATAVCDICWWEVDLADEGAPEDEVLSGPNRGYSLRRARENFRDHGHMYDPGREIAYLKHPTATRKRLMAYVASVQDGRTALDVERLTALIHAEAETVRTPDGPQRPDAAGREEEALLRAILSGQDAGRP